MKNSEIRLKKRERMVDRLPPEGLDKFKKFNAVFKIYFKSQIVAGEYFKVGQGTVNKYLSGSLLVPLSVAEKIETISNGVIKRDDIFFDLKAYEYDKKIKEKSKH